ncbi:MAG TPA: hypothetical protein VJO12_08395 [Stellaceae bacterium]|nr:hypothetical protein [Stellaceae bacterium]
MPYVSELCLFAAAFVAAFAYGEEVLERVKSAGRRLAAWRRKGRSDGWR